MEGEFASRKAKFNKALEPIKMMLVHNKKKLRKADWLLFVENAKNSIINNPNQYLERDLRPSEEIKGLIDLIFTEFLKNEL